jgi:hypothetical protein
MTRLVGEIHAARGERGRLLRDLRGATIEMRRAVAALKKGLDDFAATRDAWFRPRASLWGGAGTAGIPALVWRRRVERRHHVENPKDPEDQGTNATEVIA